MVSKPVPTKSFSPKEWLEQLKKRGPATPVDLESIEQLVKGLPQKGLFAGVIVESAADKKD